MLRLQFRSTHHKKEGQVVPALPLLASIARFRLALSKTINDRGHGRGHDHGRDHQVGHTYSSQRWRDQPDWPLPARHWIPS